MNISTSDLWDQFQKDYRQVHPFLALCICLTGMMMNVIFITVLVQKQMRTAINFLLVAIATSDFCLMTSNASAAIMKLVKIYGSITIRCPIQTYSEATIILVLADASITFYGISTWLTISLAMLRYYVISSSRIRKLENRFALKICLPILIYVVIVCTPIYICQGLSKARSRNCSTSAYYRIRESDFSRAHDGIPAMIALWSNAVLFKLAPCLLLSIFIILLVIKMSKQNRKRSVLFRQMKNKNTSGKTNQTELNELLDKTGDTATTKGKYGSSPAEQTHQATPSSIAKPRPNPSDRLNTILICILIVFLVCQLPQGIINFVTVLPGVHLKFYHKIGEFLDDVSLISSCVNFFLYCSMSTQFRDTFRQLYRWKTHQKSQLTVIEIRKQDEQTDNANHMMCENMQISENTLDDMKLMEVQI